MLGPTLATERLILRPPEAGDLDALAELMADEESARFLGGVQTRPQAWRGLATMVGSWVLKGYGMFSVLERDGGRWIGRIGPWAPEGWPGQEIGWSLRRDAWGRGYATEAASACMDFAFDTLGWSEVIHPIHPDNQPSKAVARRLGSTLLRTGRLPAPADDFDCEIWGQSARQWRARR